MMLIGVVGAGNMGGAMLARLRDQGWTVSVHDINPAREHEAAALGATVRPTAAAVGAHSDCVIVCVVDAAQTREVLFQPGTGLVAGMQAGGCVMLCPTLGPQDVEALGGDLATVGIDCLDAPMSGGPARAREGSMSLMLAGQTVVIERHRALIDALSSTVFIISERIGDGARTKLVNNLLAGINLAGAAEVMALAQRMGLDLSRTLSVIESSSGQSWIGSDRMRRAIAGDYTPRAHTTLLAKDTNLALTAAESLGFEPMLGRLARDTFARAVAEGFADEDDGSLFKRLTRR